MITPDSEVFFQRSNYLLSNKILEKLDLLTTRLQKESAERVVSQARKFFPLYSASYGLTL